MIHVVRHRWSDQSILSRKAGYLASELGWTIGEYPDPGAFINYAFPYLDYRIPNSQLPFAGYFTHREDCLPDKVEIWNKQAKAAVLRITSAQQYFDDLKQHGATVKITPPLDREKFRPLPSPRMAGPLRIGTAGIVYRGGRKGEELIARAAEELKKYEFRAMGKGWPIQTIWLPYDRIHEFYQGIDIYLCTSTIEGTGYPPLEALSCGKKIVIPKGVGVFDELPDTPGIERYRAGDYQAMIWAINRAAETTADMEVLREATAKFTIEGWIEDHAAAFAEHEKMEGKKTRRKTKQRRSDRGIFVVAFGGPARKCARRLIASIREQMPDTQVAIATDQPLPEADHNLTYDGPLGGGAREAKLAAYDLAPAEWKQVLYLDADTELAETAEPLFFALEAGWEMVFTKDINSRDTVPFLKRHKMPEDYNATLELVGAEEELALAGGVWGFARSPGAKKFLETWQAEWGEGKYRDQPSMLRAFYKTKVRAIVYGNEFNSFTEKRAENRAEIIRHYSGGTARNQPVFRTDAEVTVINISKNPVERAGLLFMPGSAVIVNKDEPKFKEIKACEVLKIY